MQNQCFLSAFLERLFQNWFSPGVKAYKMVLYGFWFSP